MESPAAANLSPDQVLTHLGLALAIGFLIGVERGWRERQAAEGERAAGLRTFALLGLSGGVWALLGRAFGDATFAAGFVAMAAAIGFFRWREAEHEGGYGATTVVAAFLTFALGAYSVIGDMTAAGGAAVAMAAILAAKGWLHSWLKTLTWEELRAAIILLAMTFVALPVLPDRGFGPYEALNPRDLWVMTIAIAGVSFMGYIAVRIAGVRYGPLIAGIAGGIVSSTITTLDLARRARRGPSLWRAQLSGALAASATMFARVTVIVALFGLELLRIVAAPLAAAFVITAAGALIFDIGRGKAASKDDEMVSYANPFELKTVLSFGAMLAAVVLASRVLTELFGERGGVAFAAVVGLGDVDAITLSMTQVAGGSVSVTAAATAILTAVSANSLSKSALALVAGGRNFGLAYIAVSIAALGGGGLVAFAEAWSF